MKSGLIINDPFQEYYYVTIISVNFDDKKVINLIKIFNKDFLNFITEYDFEKSYQIITDIFCD
jgi:hypothetical protein